MIVCYFTNWATYRSGIAKYTPENINASLCTHINYAFAFLDKTTHTITTSDSGADIDNHFIEKVVALKKQGVEVMVSIGGWTNSLEEIGWGRMFNSDKNRATFIKSVLDFLEKYGFVGLDLDYEYPACPQGNRTAGTSSDAENFNKLLSELKTAFNGKYKLSAAIGAGKSIIEECYHMSELCQIVDWVNLMAYDYHSYLDGVVGANAPTCGTGDTWGVYESLSYLTTEAKCPANKMTLGMPFYGKTYTLSDASNPGFGVVASDAGSAGTYTKSDGTLAYYEICLNQENGWKSGWSEYNDSYAWNGNQFVSFDGIEDIKRKCCLINKHFKLKGAMFWTLDFDDFTNSCKHGFNPLLTTLNQQLRCLN